MTAWVDTMSSRYGKESKLNMDKFKGLVQLSMKGFKRQVFYYRVPGDENDMSIWVKNNVVIAWNSVREYFVEVNYSDLSYEHGFPWEYAKQANIDQL